MLDGRPLYTLGLHDVSERVRTEEFLQRQRQLLELIASGTPVTDTLFTLLQVVELEAPEMHCAAYELDADGLTLRMLAAPRLPKRLRLATEAIIVGPFAAAVGTAVHRNETICSHDISTDDLWVDSRVHVSAVGFRAGWAMPLRGSDGRVIGALACYYRESRHPTARELELASTAVHLASIALASAHDARSLRSSEASFRSFVENAPAAVFRETRSGHLVSTNPAMVALLRHADSDALVRAADQGLLYADRAARDGLLGALEHQDVVRGQELDWRRADGTRVTVRLSARAYRDDEGQVWLWEGFAEDVTPLRAAEEALRRNEKLAAIGQLISGVAHELNNPLSSIMHFAEDLMADERSTEDVEALSVIRDQARRSRAIVRDLLSFVHAREARAELLLVNEVVASTVRAMGPAAESAGARLQLSALEGDATVLVDRAGLEQVVTNLLSNALQAAGPGGDVWVRSEQDEASYRLVVEDSGAGIAPDVLPRIFDPFFTTKATGEGTGLGLSVTLGIVEQFGGRIAVEPRGRAGRGTRFIVTIPRCQGAPRAASATASSSTRIPAPTVAAMSQAPCALVIDDEPTIRAALRRYFVRRGWEVEEAEDGARGLALLEAHGDRFAIIVSDLRMPGFSGVELHDRLADERPELLQRFVFSTGDVASGEAAAFVQRTACAVLQKPFELRTLDAQIERVGEGARRERVVS
jgi:two-component system NtrC family sensor kinase